ncbi:hypothetical protein Avbf_03820 [Armadillidium vulgare]|nr:hypothetical protein Avbf_03820 [Armadillidium vulgare]
MKFLRSQNSSILAIIWPDGHPRKVKVTENSDGTFTASYLPDDCGKYKINVKYGGEDVTSTPIPVQVQATGKNLKVESKQKKI